MYLCLYYICILYIVGSAKVNDQQEIEERLSRPPSIVIASSSKNKDNIIVGFGNASISSIPIFII